jgi:hypothetical protein
MHDYAAPRAGPEAEEDVYALICHPQHGSTAVEVQVAEHEVAGSSTHARSRQAVATR